MSYPLRGLRVRLTGFYLAGFTLFLLAGWIGLAWTVDRSLHQGIDRSLTETIRAAREVYAQDRGEFSSEVFLVAHVISELIYADRALAGYTPDGRRIAKSRHFVGSPAIDNLRSVEVGERPTTIQTSSGRARAIATVLPGGTRLVVAISLDPVDRHRRALIVAVIVLLPLVAVAGVAGLYLARRALAPMTRFAAAAGSIGAVVESGARSLPRLPAHPVADELGQLTGEFNRLLDRLAMALERERSLSEGQRRFLQDAAHELRTPIAIVRSEAEAALAAHRNPESDEQALGVIAAETTRMASLVDGLLWLTRSESESALSATERLFLDDLVPALLIRVRRLPAARDRDIRVGHFDVAPIQGNRALIERAILSLLENALVHGAPAPVEVSAGRDAAASPTSWVRVRDYGPGIPPDQVDRLMDRFTRLHTAVPGSGLGLAIARRAAEVHGGRLEVEHPADGGIAFTLRLPAA